MRKISNYNNQELQKEQFETFAKIIHGIDSEKDMEFLFDCFLTRSEKTVLAQRLNIMRMLAKRFSYQNIRKILRVSPSTIATAQRCLEEGGDELRDILLAYRHKPKKRISNSWDKESFIKPNFPGAIRF